MMFSELLYPRKFEILIKDLVMGVLSLVPLLGPVTPDHDSLRHAQYPVKMTVDLSCLHRGGNGFFD